jgi:hypothetical protein
MSAAPTCTAVPVKSGSTPRPPGSSGPGASMAHVKKVLGHVPERMSESYVLIAGTQVEPTSAESPDRLHWEVAAGARIWSLSSCRFVPALPSESFCSSSIHLDRSRGSHCRHDEPE